MNLPLLHLKAGARHALIVTDHMQLGRDLGSLLSLLICLLRRRSSRVPGQLLGLISIFNFPQLQSRERESMHLSNFSSHYGTRRYSLRAGQTLTRRALRRDDEPRPANLLSFFFAKG